MPSMQSQAAQTKVVKIAVGRQDRKGPKAHRQHAWRRLRRFAAHRVIYRLRPVFQSKPQRPCEGNAHYC